MTKVKHNQYFKLKHINGKGVWRRYYEWLVANPDVVVTANGINKLPSRKCNQPDMVRIEYYIKDNELA